MCHDAFNLLKKYLTEGPIIKYPNLENHIPLQMQVNIFWHVLQLRPVLESFDRKDKIILQPITYRRGLPRGSQLNWASLTKEAYFMCMPIKSYSILTMLISLSEVTT